MIILPSLPYEKNALEPFISAKTLEFHYDKHHAGYVNNLNKLIENTDFNTMSLVEIINKTHQKKDYTAIFNNSAQIWNHTFFWNSMKPNASSVTETQVDVEFLTKINEDFGSRDKLKEAICTAAVSQFGSGWAWLVFNKVTNKLEILKTSNAETPLTNNQYEALIVVDVWEHAYYLDYQNRRSDYVKSFVDNLLSWEFACDNFLKFQ